MNQSTVLSIVLLCFIQRWYFPQNYKPFCTAKELHLSKEFGKDILTCGKSQIPCKSLAFSLKIAERGDTLLADGTNTAQNPYTCESESNTSPKESFLISKSLSLIGQRVPAYVMCTKGVSFTTTNQSNPLSITISRISFLNTRLRFNNSSVQITDCLFIKTLERDQDHSSNSTVGGAVDGTMDAVLTVAQSNNFFLSRSTFRDNKIPAINISSMASHGKLTFVSSLFENNTGGIAAYGMRQGSVEIRDTAFYQNGKAASIYLQLMSNSQVMLDNITIERARVSPGLQGAALFVSCGLALGTSVLVQHSRFLNNWNTSPGAGAVCIDNAPEALLSPGCLNQDYPPYPVYQNTNNIQFKSCVFERNYGTQAGAAFISNGLVSFNDCVFKDNFVDLHARHVFVAGGSGGVEFVNSSLLHSKEKPHHRSLLSVIPLSLETSGFVYSGGSGPLVFKNTSLRFLPLKEKNIVTVVDGGRIEIDNASRITCPIGGVMVLSDQSHEVLARAQPGNMTSCRLYVKVLTISCALCPPNFYSLVQGEMQGFTVHNSENPCALCPYGGNCSDGHNIVALSDFYGFKTPESPPKLDFYRCPLNYCKPPNDPKGSRYNGCRGNRSGILCGACADGYTEALFSTKCRLSKNCNDSAFWFIAILFVLFLTWYFIRRPPVVPLLVSRFFKKHWNCFASNGNHSNKLSDPGYLKVIVYFYQVAGLLLVQTSLERVLMSHFVVPVISVFNFQIRTSVPGFECPFPGLNVVTRELFLTLGVVAVALMVLATYGAQKAYLRLRHRTEPSFSPYIGALLNIAIFGYSTLATSSCKLLLCVPIGQDWRLFYDGNITCFQWWQYLIFLFVVVYVIPFIGVLFWGSKKLNTRDVSARELLNATLFPLIYLLKWAVCKKKAARASETLQSDELEAAVEVLHGPFKLPCGVISGKIYWDSVLIGRRFLLIIQATFIANPSLKLVTMTVTCFLYLMHHFVTNPYKDPKVNLVESVSMATLVLLGIFNIVQATYIAAAITPAGPNHKFVEVLSWIEAGLLVTGPVLLLFSVLFSLLVVIINSIFHLAMGCMALVVHSPSRSSNPVGHRSEDGRNEISELENSNRHSIPQDAIGAIH